MQWSKNMQLIDANVILRYLLNDTPDMAQRAKAVVSAGAYTKPEIIAEVVYVLQGVYSVPRENIQKYVHSLLDDIQCSEESSVDYAAKLFAETSLDFVDCLLIAYHVVNGENIFSFDKKLNRRLNSISEKSDA